MIIHDSLEDIDKAINTGIVYEEVLKEKRSARKYMDEISKDMRVLSDIKSKMKLFRSEWSKDKEKRHILSPLLSKLTGLATKKTTQQLRNALMKVNMNQQKNHMITGILERNQKEIYQAVEKDMDAIRTLEKNLNANTIEKHTYRYAMEAARNFRRITQQVTKHYEALLRATENKMETFNILSTDKLDEIELALSNYADVGDNIPQDASIISLVKNAKFEIIITKDNQIMLTYFIPLVDKETYYIKHLHENQVLLQNNADGDTYTTIDLDMINTIHGNTVTISERPILHYRKHNSWGNERELTKKATLRDNTLLIADIPAGKIQITCRNGSNEYRHSGEHTLAIHLELSCSLTTPNFKIKATKLLSSLNIKQELTLESTMKQAETVKLLPETRTTIMNLTKIPDALNSQESLFMATITSKEWISSAIISITITATPWLILFLIGFCKRSKV